MRFELSRTFPASRLAGYEYLTDLTTWDEWAPIQIPDAEDAKFSAAEDLVAYRYRPLGFPMRGTMRLVEKVEGELFKLLFEQKTFPEIEMTWLFSNAGAHAFTLTVVIEIDEATWWDKTHQWTTVPMKRDIREAFEGLHEHFAARELVKVAS